MTANPLLSLLNTSPSYTASSSGKKQSISERLGSKPPLFPNRPPILAQSNDEPILSTISGAGIAVTRGMEVILKENTTLKRKLKDESEKLENKERFFQAQETDLLNQLHNVQLESQTRLSQIESVYSSKLEQEKTRSSNLEKRLEETVAYAQNIANQLQDLDVAQRTQLSDQVQKSNDLEKKLALASENLKSATEEKHGLSLELDHEKGRTSELEKLLREAKTSGQSYVDENRQLSSQIETLVNDMRAKESALIMMEEQMEYDRKSFESKGFEMKRTLEKAQLDIQLLERKNKELDGSVNQLSSSNSEIEYKLNEFMGIAKSELEAKKRISARLNEVERDLQLQSQQASAEIEKVNKMLEEALVNVKEKDVECRNLTFSLSNANSDIHELKSQLELKDRHLNSFSQKNQELKEQINKLENDINDIKSDYEAKVKESKKITEQKTREVQLIQLSAKELLENLSQVSASEEEFKEKFHNLDTKFKSFKKESEKREQENQRASIEFSEAIENLTRNNQELEKSKNILDAKIHSLEKALTLKNDDIQKLQGSLDEAAREKEKHLQEISISKDRLVKLENTIDKLNSESESKSSEIIKFQNESKLLEQKIQESENFVVNQSRKIEDLDKELENVKFALKSENIEHESLLKSKEVLFEETLKSKTLEIERVKNSSESTLTNLRTEMENLVQSYNQQLAAQQQSFNSEGNQLRSQISNLQDDLSRSLTERETVVRQLEERIDKFKKEYSELISKQETMRIQSEKELSEMASRYELSNNQLQQEKTEILNNLETTKIQHEKDLARLTAEKTREIEELQIKFNQKENSLSSQFDSLKVATKECIVDLTKKLESKEKLFMTTVETSDSMINSLRSELKQMTKTNEEYLEEIRKMKLLIKTARKTFDEQSTAQQTVVHDLQKSLEKQNRENTYLNDQLLDRKSQQDKLDALNLKLEQEIKNLKSELDSITAEKASLSASNESKANEIENLKMDLQNLQNKLQQEEKLFQDRIKKSNQERLEIEKEVFKMKKEVSTVLKSREDERKKNLVCLDEAEVEIKKYYELQSKAQVQKIQSLLDDMEDRFIEADRERTQIKQDLKALRAAKDNHIKSLKKSNEESEIYKDQLKKTIDELESKVASVRLEKESLKQEEIEFVEKEKNIQQKLMNITGVNEELKKENQLLTEKNQTLLENLEQTQNQYNDVSESHAQLKKDLDSLKLNLTTKIISKDQDISKLQQVLQAHSKNQEKYKDELFQQAEHERNELVDRINHLNSVNSELKSKSIDLKNSLKAKEIKITDLQTKMDKFISESQSELAEREEKITSLVNENTGIISQLKEEHLIKENGFIQKYQEMETKLKKAVKEARTKTSASESKLEKLLELSKKFILSVDQNTRALRSETSSSNNILMNQINNCLDIDTFDSILSLVTKDLNDAVAQDLTRLNNYKESSSRIDSQDNDLKQRIHELTAQIHSIRQEKQSVESKFEEFKNKAQRIYSKMREDLSNNHKEKNDLNAQISKLSSTLESLKSEKDFLNKSDNDHRTRELERNMEHNQQIFEQKLHNKDELIKDLRRDLEKTKSSISDEREKYLKQKNAFKKLEKELNDYEAKASARLKDIEMENKRKEYSNVDFYREKFQALENQLFSFRQDNTVLQTEKKELEAKYQSLKIEYEGLDWKYKAELNKLKLFEKGNEMETLATERSQYKQLYDETKAKYKSLKKSFEQKSTSETELSQLLETERKHFAQTLEQEKKVLQEQYENLSSQQKETIQKLSSDLSSASKKLKEAEDTIDISFDRIKKLVDQESIINDLLSTDFKDLKRSRDWMQEIIESLEDVVTDQTPIDLKLKLTSQVISLKHLLMDLEMKDDRMQCGLESILTVSEGLLYNAKNMTGNRKALGGSDIPQPLMSLYQSIQTHWPSIVPHGTPQSLDVLSAALSSVIHRILDNDNIKESSTKLKSVQLQYQSVIDELKESKSLDEQIMNILKRMAERIQSEFEKPSQNNHEIYESEYKAKLDRFIYFVVKKYKNSGRIAIVDELEALSVSLFQLVTSINSGREGLKSPIHQIVAKHAELPDQLDLKEVAKTISELHEKIVNQ